MTTRRNNRKWLWWGTGILIVSAIAVAVAVVTNNGRTDELTSENSDNNQVAENSVEEKKKEEKSEEQSVEEEAKKEDVKQYEGDSPNKSETLTGVISYAGVSGENLMVRVNIDQYLAGGSCKMNLIKDGATIYNNTVAIESSVSTSTCNGFNVPVSELSNGNFKIEVALESDGKYGKIVGEVSI